MNIKQTIRTFAVAMFLMLGIIFAILPATANAECIPNEPCCGGVPTAVLGCEQSGGDDVEDTGLWGLLILTINIMTAGVGVLAVAGFLYGGFLYITSGGSPEQVKKAKTVFTNVVIGVIAFGGMFALLNFLVPGGVFN